MLARSCTHLRRYSRLHKTSLHHAADGIDMTAAVPRLHRKSTLQRYGFLWVTLVLFLGSTIAHWTAGWSSFKQEQQEHGQPAEFSSFVPEALRDTFENWQAEFMGIAWQIVGLSLLYAVGSPQSKEGDERKEKKLDLLLRKVDPENADKEIEKLDRDYSRT
jgi:hypothetical protein